MRNWIFEVREALVRLHGEDAGQDLIEYALIAALIALGAIAGMRYVAVAINSAFSSVGGRLVGNLS